MPFTERKLTLDPNNKEQSLNYADRSERLRELVKERKASGLDAKDPAYVASLLREVAAMNISSINLLELVHETSFDLSEYNQAELNINSVFCQQDELFVRVQSKDGESAHLLNIDGKPINPHPALKNYGITGIDKPIFYQGKICFKLRYYDSEGEMIDAFINHHGEFIGDENLKAGAGDFIEEVLENDKDILGFNKVKTINEIGNQSGQIFNLNGEAVTNEEIELRNSVVLEGKWAYLANNGLNFTDGQSAVWGDDRIETHNEQKLSAPFLFNGKVCVCCHKSIDGADQIVIRDIQTKEAVTLAQPLHDEISSISQVVASGDKCLVKVVCRDSLGDPGYPNAYMFKFGKFEPTRITEARSMNLHEIGGRLSVVAYVHVDGKRKRKIVIDGLGEQTVNAIVGEHAPVGMVEFHQIYTTSKPIEIFGQQGSIFYMARNLENRETLFVDNSPIDLEKDSALTCNMFCVVNDHLFWNDQLDFGGEKLYMDGKQMKGKYDKILKVVYSNNKYFVVAVLYNKLIVKALDV